MSDNRTNSYRLQVLNVARWARDQYRKLAWPSAPSHCGSLADIAAAAGGTTSVRSPARDQLYALPPCCDEDVRAFFGQFARMSMPDEVRCTVPRGRVVSDGVILSPDGRTLARDVSVVFSNREDFHPMLHMLRIPPPRRLAGSTLNIASAGGASYYHWLLDELPRFLEAVHEQYDNVVGTPWHLRRVADAFGFRGRLIAPRPDRHYKCDLLHVASLFGRTGHPTPEGVDIIRRFGNQLLGSVPAQPKGRRLFISRSAAQVRRLVHETELWGHLESRGFERLFLERMSWEEQISAFAAADVIVAPHGAGLANLAFCRPGTRVIELFHRGYLHWCYWQLSSVAGLHYQPVVNHSNAPLAHDFSHLGSDIDVPWSAVAAAL